MTKKQRIEFGNCTCMAFSIMESNLLESVSWITSGKKLMVYGVASNAGINYEDWL